MNIKVVYSEEDEQFVATCDREGMQCCSALADTEAEALREFADVLDLLKES